VASVFTVGIVGSVLLFVRSIRKDRLDAEALARAHERYLRSFDAPDYDDVITEPASNPVKVTRFTPSQALLRERGYITPAHDAIRAQAQAPVYYGHPGYVGGMDPSLAMVEGMLIGEALGGHNHTTEVIESNHSVDNSPSYSDSSSSSDSYSSSSSDSGFSYSDSGSSYSDSGSSGGFDTSW
jgi:hypothetical protein